MDQSLRLLLRLRLNGWFRRWVRNLRTVKGILLAVVGVLLLLPMFSIAVIAPRAHGAGHAEGIQRYGALFLLFYCVMGITASGGDRALYYSPAEISFLFCGPYRPRQLLSFKLLEGIGATLFSCLFLSLIVQQHAPSYPAALIGLFVATTFVYLFGVAVSLIISTAGALAFSLPRKLVLVAVGALAAATLAQVGRELPDLSGWQAVDRLLSAPVMRAVLTPFQPFVRTFTSSRLWPDLLGWSAVSLAIDLALVAVVLALNAQFLEASATASARLYGKVRQARRNPFTPLASATSRRKVPMLPWWGGIGPTFWRQLTTAARSTGNLVLVLVFFTVPILIMLFLLRNQPQGESYFNGGYACLFILATVTLYVPNFVGFDFRPDLVRIEELKTLPIAPGRLAIGEMATPVLIMTIGHALALACIRAQARIEPWILLSIFAFVPPVNLLLIAMENLYFLWFPTRWGAGGSTGFEVMGRVFVFMMGKMFCVVLVLGIAAGMGAAGYYLGGGSWTVALVPAWLTVAGAGIALIPLIAFAFVRYDVARDRLE